MHTPRKSANSIRKLTISLALVAWVSLTPVVAYASEGDPSAYGQTHWVSTMAFVAAIVIRWERLLRPLWAAITGQYPETLRYMWIPPALAAASGVLVEALYATDLFAVIQLILAAVTLVVVAAMKPHDDPPPPPAEAPPDPGPSAQLELPLYDGQEGGP